MGEKYLRTTLVDFGVVNFAIGKLNRRFQGGPHLEALALQPNSDCNAKPKCPGCFAGENEGKLDYETLDKILSESKDLTSRFTIVLGGEPLLEKTNLLRLFSKYKRMPFMIFTNGKLLDETYAKTVADLGNVITFINMPGLEPTATKLRRDPNVWIDIKRAAENLQKYSAASGFSSTVYQANFEDLSSPEFAQQMIDFGMMLGFYFPYKNAVGCSPKDELALSPEMNDEFSRRVKDISTQYPLILINASDGEEKIGGCLSAKGSIVYIKSDGNVAACPMVPQSNNKLNVKNASLREILKSPYFEFVRSHGKGFPCLTKSDEFLAKSKEYVS